MKLFLVSQWQNNSYDTYDSAVVAAPDEDTARTINPRTGEPIENWKDCIDAWCNEPEHVVVKYIGEADAEIEQGVVCASFNAG